MRITDIRERTVTLADPMRNASIAFNEMTLSAVAIETDLVRDGRKVIGYGIGSVGRYGVGGLLRERFIPRLAGEEASDLLDDSGANLDPFGVWDVLMRNEKGGGHGERSSAVGLLDMAVWDIVAKAEGVPLWRLLADRFNGGKADETVFVYASGGHYHPGGDLDALKTEIRAALARGFVTMKIKAGANGIDDDRRRIDAALEIVGDPSRLAIDVNGSFSSQAAIDYATALEDIRLGWIEEIAPPLDYETLAAVSAAYGGPLATGENLFSFDDTRNLLRYGGIRPKLDLLQVDIALSYGLVEYLRILDLVDAGGWSRRQCLPHAGHLMALHAAAGLQLGGHEMAADPGSLFGGAWDGAEIADGRIRLEDAPGLGIERNAALFAVVNGLVA